MHIRTLQIRDLFCHTQGVQKYFGVHSTTLVKSENPLMQQWFQLI